MLVYLVLYILFCTSIAATSLITIANPVIKRIKKARPLNDVSQHANLALFIFFIMALLMAPLVVVPTIIPKYNLSFKDTFYETLEA